MATRFPRTLTVGTYRSKLALRSAVLRRGFHIADRAEGLIHSDWFRVEPVERRLDLAFLRVGELDPSDFPTVSSVLFALEISAEFAPCPPETALFLRMQLEQREGEWFTVVSQPVYCTTHESWAFFALGRENGCSEIGGSFANPDFPWPLGEWIVLCRKQQ